MPDRNSLRHVRSYFPGWKRSLEYFSELATVEQLTSRQWACVKRLALAVFGEMRVDKNKVLAPMS